MEYVVSDRMVNEILRPGKVYLVGAGPGDPGLITRRALQLIRKAEVIIYDHLANPDFIAEAPPDAKKIFVGKEASQHTLPQGKINELIVEKARTGKMVVRLKGGDPFIFGRGGEEAEYCAENGIPFEIVPGLTSAIAVPAYAGIPLTHRDFTTTVAFITGHEKPDKDHSTIPWKELATGPKTLVFLMGVNNLPFICQSLIDNGCPSQTPAAVIRWGTLACQRTIVGILSDIAQKVEESCLTPPAIIVIGEVVKLRETLNWFEKKPLFGKKIVVTRSRTQASQLLHILDELGAEVTEYPTIRISYIDPNPALEKAVRELSTFDWIIFTSVNGVEGFFRSIERLGFDARALGRSKIAAIGPATADDLKKWGIRADFIPEFFQAEGVIKGLAEYGIKGKNILIPRAAEAREILPEQLSQEGAHVLVIPVYETLPDEKANTEELAEQIKTKRISMITFTSSSTVTNFFAGLKGKVDKQDFYTVAMACIGPITEKKLEEMGFKAAFVAKQYTIPDLVQGIVQFYTEIFNPEKKG